MQTVFRKFLNKPFAFTSKRFFADAQFDVAVIGGGPGGYVAAIKAGQLGLKTCCIEKRESLGGTCLNVGCIPSKALLNISHKYEDSTKHFADFGLKVSGVSVDWAGVQKKKSTTVTALTKGIEMLFGKNKVENIKGYAKITGKNTIEVEGPDGKKRTVNTKNIIIASGSEPTPFPGIPFDEKTIVSSTGALSLANIPKKLIVVGGGVIGLELGSVYARFGTEVVVVEFLDRIVTGADTELATQFSRLLSKQGIKIMTKTKVLSGKNTASGVEVVVQPVAGGKEQTLTGDVLLVATGRRAFTEKLGVAELGLSVDKAGRLEVNEHFQTNIPNIFAVGDVVKGPMLAHKAEEEGIACVEHIAGKGGHVNYNAIPGVIYTNPEFAWVGKTEEQLKEEKVAYNKGFFPFVANSRAKANSETDGTIKVLSDKTTDRILGVHVIGPNAGEMIAEAVLAIEYGASSEDIARTCHAHPTLSEALKEACMAVYSKPIHC